jgi:sterol 14alpha-demethylase
MTTAIVPRVSGGEEEHGHLEEFRTDPIGLMQRTRDECGDVGWFQLADKHVILLSGAGANEFFFRSADEDLDQAAAYPFMAARVWYSMPARSGARRCCTTRRCAASR